MTKEYLIRAAIGIINEEADKRNLTVINNGTGHAYDHMLWKDMLKDESEIPNVIAETEGYKIELRSFWGEPEIDIRDIYGLLVLTYADYVQGEDPLVHTGDYRVHQVRVDSFNYEDGLKEIQRIIKRIEENYHDR